MPCPLPLYHSSRLPKQQQLKKQDEGLDMLSKSADRLGQLSMNIHEELGQQNKWVFCRADFLGMESSGRQCPSPAKLKIFHLSLPSLSPNTIFGRMLDDMEEDLDRTTVQLGFVTRKTRELILKSGGKKNFLLVAGLSLVVVILVFLIIYT